MLHYIYKQAVQPRRWYLLNQTPHFTGSLFIAYKLLALEYVAIYPLSVGFRASVCGYITNGLN